MGNLPPEKEVISTYSVSSDVDDILDSTPKKEIKRVYKEMGKILNTSICFDDGMVLIDGSREISLSGYYEE